jgi:hypothetical protein
MMAPRGQIETLDGPALATGKAPRTPRPWVWIGTTAALFLIVGALAAVSFFSRQSLGAEREQTAQLQEDLTASEQTATDLEGQFNGLEGEVNGLNVEAAQARTCIAGLSDAVDAVDGLFGTEDWLTFYNRSDDVRRICQQVETAGFTV